MMALVAAGGATDLVDAAARIPAPAATVTPRSSATLAEELYGRYRRLVAQLMPLHDMSWR
jgi:hypothetical protein